MYIHIHIIAYLNVVKHIHKQSLLCKQVFMYRHMQTQNEDTHAHTCFDSYLHRHTYIHMHAYARKNM